MTQNIQYKVVDLTMYYVPCYCGWCVFIRLRFDLILLFKIMSGKTDPNQKSTLYFPICFGRKTN